MEDLFAQMATVINNYYTKDNDPDRREAGHSF